MSTRKITSDDISSLTSLNSDEMELIYKMKKAITTKPTTRTLVNYLNIVKRIYKIEDVKFNPKDISYLYNTQNIIKLLNEPSRYKNPKDYYWSVIQVLKAFNDTKDIIEIYSTEMGKFLKKSAKQRGENKKTEKEGKNWMDYDTVIDMFNKRKNTLNENDKLLMTLILTYPRRLADWYRMKVKTSSSKLNNINDNYLVTNKYRVPIKFIFNRQKTSQYEDVNKDIPKTLYKSIYDYLTIFEPKEGDLLFPNKSGAMYKAPDFSNKISNLFKDITGKRITNNLWRHIYITKFGSDKSTLNQKKALSGAMGHSIKTQMEYFKK